MMQSVPTQAQLKLADFLSQLQAVSRQTCACPDSAPPQEQKEACSVACKRISEGFAPGTSKQTLFRKLCTTTIQKPLVCSCPCQSNDSTPNHAPLRCTFGSRDALAHPVWLCYELCQAYQPKILGRGLCGGISTLKSSTLCVPVWKW